MINLFVSKLIVPAVCLVPQQCILISIQGNRTRENNCLPADIVIDCSFFRCWNGSVCRNHVICIIKYYTSRNATVWNISGPLLILSESTRMGHTIKGLSCAISVTGDQDLVMLSHTLVQSPTQVRPLMIQVELLLKSHRSNESPKWCFGTGVCVSCEELSQPAWAPSGQWVWCKVSAAHLHWVCALRRC